MTVTAQNARRVVVNDGNVDEITVNFPAEQVAYIKVYAGDVDGFVERLSIGTDYTVTGAAPGSASFVVNILNPSAWDVDAYPRFAVLVDYPVDQPSNVGLGGSFGARFEAALDRIALTMQTMGDKIERAVKAPLTSTINQNNDLVSKPGAVVGWDADGALTNYYPADFVNTAGVATAAQGAVAETLQQSAAAAAANFHPLLPPSFVRTAGLTVPGDGGDALYVYKPSMPTHYGRMSITLLGGQTAWYEIADRELKLRSFGAKGDGSECTTEVARAFAAGAALGRRVVDHGGVYKIGNVLPPLGLIFKGAGRLTQFRPNASNITLFSYVLGASGGCFQDWDDFSIYCEGYSGIKGFQFTLANVFAINNIVFMGCETCYDADRGGHFELGTKGPNVSEGTVSNKSGRFSVQSSVDTAYGGAFSAFGRNKIKNNGNGIQDPAYYFRRVTPVRFSGISIDISNDGTFENTSARVGIGVLVENDCQGLNISGVVCGVDRGFVTRKGAGVSVAPNVIDISQLNVDQCFTRSVDIEDGYNITLSDLSVTSSSVAKGTVGAVRVKPGCENIRFNNPRVSGYDIGSGTAFMLDGADGVVVDGGLLTGVMQGFSVAAATNCKVRGVKNRNTPVGFAGRVGNPGAGTTFKDCEGINPYDPWALSTPVPVATTPGVTPPVFGTSALRWMRDNSQDKFAFTVAVTTAGTGAGPVKVPLPFTAFVNASGGGKESGINGKGLSWIILASSSELVITYADGTTPIANGAILNVEGFSINSL